MQEFTLIRGSDRSDYAQDQINRFFRLRKRQFVDQMGWDLMTRGDLEIDQYDHSGAIYCLGFGDGRMISGLRLLPTDITFAGWSYMIRDANMGYLPGLAQAMIVNPPQSADCYEITRLCADPDLDARARNRALGGMAHFAFDTLLQMGARNAIALLDPRYKNWLVARGFGARVISDVYHFAQGQYAVLSGALYAAQMAA